MTVSRTHPDLVRGLFALEVPEIADGIVEIAAIAREAGHRTKIAVRSTVPGSTPRAPASARWARGYAAVTTELHGEKIDIIDWGEDPARFVGNALARPLSSDRGRPGRAPPASSCPTSSCRWPSARRARTPASPPG